MNEYWVYSQVSSTLTEKGITAYLLLLKMHIIQKIPVRNWLCVHTYEDDRAFDIKYIGFMILYFWCTILRKKERKEIEWEGNQACATKFDILVIYRTDASGTSARRKIPEIQRLRM
jgi:hypothetical protein